MERELAQKLVRENEEYRLREGYSGRGMYGRETNAIIVSSRDDVGYLRKQYEGLRWDEMGLDYIVY